jgi:hypothetical protein
LEVSVHDRFGTVVRQHIREGVYGGAEPLTSLLETNRGEEESSWPTTSIEGMPLKTFH